MKPLLATIALLLLSPIALADLSATSCVNDTLDVLYNVGKDLQSLSADVKMVDIDRISEADTTRTGKISLQNTADRNARVHVAFEKFTNDKGTQDQKRDYVLDNGWLLTREYDKKHQTDLQLRPGEKVDLFKLGEGPFPLPIGQKPEEVLKQFDAQVIELAGPDLKDAVHLMLTPKPGTRLERKFSRVDVWADFRTGLPRQIETTDRNISSMRRVEFENVKLNPALPDSTFRLPDIDMSTWTKEDKPYTD